MSIPLQEEENHLFQSSSLKSQRIVDTIVKACQTWCLSEHLEPCSLIPSWFISGTLRMSSTSRLVSSVYYNTVFLCAFSFENWGFSIKSYSFETFTILNKRVFSVEKFATLLMIAFPPINHNFFFLNLCNKIDEIIYFLTTAENPNLWIYKVQGIKINSIFL